MTRTLLRSLAHRRAFIAALLLGTLVSAPALATGWFNDDFVMRLLLDEGIAGYPLGPTQLYEFTPPDVPATVAVEQGFLAWFTAPDFSLRFFRPLSSLTLALDAWLFGRSALAAHGHQLLWFLALVFVVARLHRRVLRPSAAGLATLIYAIGSMHGMSMAWVSARHVLVGGTFAALTILLHVGWRQTGERWRGLLAPVALSLGLLSSEATLGAVAFVVLYEALARGDARGVRARACAPALGFALSYLAFYALTGWGVQNSGTYLSPFSDPLAYAQAALVRVPILLAEQFGALPSESSGVEALLPVLVGWGLVTGALVVLLLRVDRVGRRERWLLAATLLALAPVVGGFLGGRLLVVAGIGGSGLIATALVRGLVRGAKPGRARFVARAGVAMLLLLHLGVAPLGRLGLGEGIRQLAIAEEAHARGLELDACGDAQLLYSLTGADPSNSMYLASSALYYTPARIARFEAVRALSMAVTPQRFTRDGERTFTLEILGARVVSPIEGVHYAEPQRAGARRTVREMTVHVTDATDEGWTRARFEVDRPLEQVCFGAWDGEALRLWRAPGIGESRELPYVPGVMGM